MTKKIVPVVLVLILSIFIFVGCGKENEVHEKTVYITRIHDGPKVNGFDPDWYRKNPKFDPNGYYDKEMDEWVYPNSIDRDKYRRYVSDCRRYRRHLRGHGHRHHLRYPEEVYVKLEQILEKVTYDRMSTSTKRTYFAKKFRLTWREARMINEEGRIPRSVIYKIQDFFNCNYYHARRLAYDLFYNN